MGIVIDKLTGNPLLIDIKESDLSSELQAKIDNGTLPTWLSEKLLFLGYTSKLSAGEIPNELGTDTIQVSGTTELFYLVPNTQPYIDADTDKIWFDVTDGQRNASENELVGYDFSRTFIWYNSITPYQIYAIAILKAGETLTTSQMNYVRTFFDLSNWWDNTLSIYGSLKQNRNFRKSIWSNLFAIYNPFDLTTVTKGTDDYMSQLRDALGSEHTLNGLCKWTNKGMLFEGNLHDHIMKTAEFDYPQPIFVYLLITQLSYIQGRRIFDGFANDSVLIYNQYSGSPYIAPSAGTVTYIEDAGLIIGEPHIVRCLFNGGDSKIQTDTNTAQTGNFGVNAANGITLGNRAGGSFSFHGIIHKAIFSKVVDGSSFLLGSEAAIYADLLTLKNTL